MIKKHQWISYDKLAVGAYSWGGLTRGGPMQGFMVFSLRVQGCMFS